MQSLERGKALELELELPEEAIARLGELSGFRLGFPREFLESEGVRELIFGDTYGLIDRRGSRAKTRAPLA